MAQKQLLAQLAQYASSIYITQEEQSTLTRFKDFVAQNPTCFERSNAGHVTSSIWIVSHDKDKALLTHHKKLNIWLQLGGHNDGDHDCKAVALKEAQEESGITTFNFLIPTIFDIDIHPIPTKCAYHYDIRYLLQALPEASYTVSEESHDLAWIPHDQLEKYTTERSVLRLNEKFKQHFL